MILSISTTHQPARDLGFLLGKHPDRLQRFSLSFGSAIVFYPTANEELCEVCLMLEVDTVDLVRGKKAGNKSGGKSGGAVAVEGYVNDRPYVASSLMSVAISRVFGTAISGTCSTHPQLAEARLPLQVRIDVLPSHGGASLIDSIFSPLGYEVQVDSYPLDEQLPDLGASHYHTATLRGNVRLQDLLSHLYVLIPVFDHHKHYFIGNAEVDKLLRHGEGWLPQHPMRDWIARRYLPHRRSLVNEAIARLTPETSAAGDDADSGIDAAATSLDQQDDSPTPRLHDLRLEAVVQHLLDSGASSVVDLGCGEGRLLKKLMPHKKFQRIVGVDICVRSLEFAARRLRLEETSWSAEPDAEPRVRLLHGALTYRDQRLKDFDAAVLVEVIEHIDLERLPSLEQVVFGEMHYQTVVVTTPNREYNAMFEGMADEAMRHGDHRFEWTRAEFQHWVDRVAVKYHYKVQVDPLGPEDPNLGAPSQLAIFHLKK